MLWVLTSKKPMTFWVTQDQSAMWTPDGTVATPTSSLTTATTVASDTLRGWERERYYDFDIIFKYKRKCSFNSNVCYVYFLFSAWSPSLHFDLYFSKFLPFSPSLSCMRLTNWGCCTSRWGTWIMPMAQMLPTSRTNWECLSSCATRPQTRNANSFPLPRRWKEPRSQQNPLQPLLPLRPCLRLTWSTCVTLRIPSASPTLSTFLPALCPCSVTHATTPTARPRRPPPRLLYFSILHLFHQRLPHLQWL